MFIAGMLLLAVLGSLLVADFVFSMLAVFPDYVAARIGLEYFNEQLRMLRGDKRAERRRRKLLPKVDEARRRLTRGSIVRLLIILPLYVATAYVSISNPIILPLPCCIEVFTVKIRGFCVMTGAIYIALAYVMFIPLVQESLTMMLMLKRGWLEWIARRLERW